MNKNYYVQINSFLVRTILRPDKNLFPHLTIIIIIFIRVYYRRFFFLVHTKIFNMIKIIIKCVKLRTHVNYIKFNKSIYKLLPFTCKESSKKYFLFA